MKAVQDKYLLLPPEFDSAFLTVTSRATSDGEGMERVMASVYDTDICIGIIKKTRLIESTKVAIGVLEAIVKSASIDVNYDQAIEMSLI